MPELLCDKIVYHCVEVMARCLARHQIDQLEGEHAKAGCFRQTCRVFRGNLKSKPTSSQAELWRWKMGT